MVTKNKNPVILERIFVPEGTKIIKEGDDGNCAYILQSGSAVVYTENNGEQIILSNLVMGDIFGEMALIFDAPRTATVETKEGCNLIIINRETLNRKLVKTDATVRAIVYMLIDRMMESNKKLSDNKEYDIQDMEKMANNMYENVLMSVPPGDKKKFQASVLPAMESFLSSLKEFK